MINLKLQYFGLLMGRTDSLEKTLMLGNIEGRRNRGQQRMSCWMASPTWWIWVWAGSESWWWTRKPGVLQSMGSQRVGQDWATELNWNLSWSSVSFSWTIPFLEPLHQSNLSRSSYHQAGLPWYTTSSCQLSVLNIIYIYIIYILYIYNVTATFSICPTLSFCTVSTSLFSLSVPPFLLCK